MRLPLQSDRNEGLGTQRYAWDVKECNASDVLGGANEAAKRGKISSGYPRCVG